MSAGQPEQQSTSSQVGPRTLIKVSVVFEPEPT